MAPVRCSQPLRVQIGHTVSGCIPFGRHRKVDEHLGRVGEAARLQPGGQHAVLHENKISAPVLRRGVHHGIQGVVAGGHQDGAGRGGGDGVVAADEGLLGLRGVR